MVKVTPIPPSVRDLFRYYVLQDMSDVAYKHNPDFPSVEEYAKYWNYTYGGINDKKKSKKDGKKAKFTFEGAGKHDFVVFSGKLSIMTYVFVRTAIELCKKSESAAEVVANFGAALRSDGDLEDNINGIHESKVKSYILEHIDDEADREEYMANRGIVDMVYGLYQCTAKIYSRFLSTGEEIPKTGMKPFVLLTYLDIYIASQHDATFDNIFRRLRRDLSEFEARHKADLAEANEAKKAAKDAAPEDEDEKAAAPEEDGPEEDDAPPAKAKSTKAAASSEDDEKAAAPKPTKAPKAIKSTPKPAAAVTKTVTKPKAITKPAPKPTPKPEPVPEVPAMEFAQETEEEYDEDAD